MTDAGYDPYCPLCRPHGHHWIGLGQGAGYERECHGEPRAEADHRFVVDEFGPRDFTVRDTHTHLSYDHRFTRKAAQEAADRRNATITKEHR